MFLVSKSDAMQDFGFEVMKQLIHDVVEMITTGAQVRVAVVSFVVHPNVVFGFTNTPDVSYILEHTFTGDTVL